MPRNDELVTVVFQLQSKVEFMMDLLFTKMDKIYQVKTFI